MSADPTSLSNPKEAIVTHINWNVTADFDNKILAGFAELTVKALIDGTKTVVFDTKLLKISRVEDAKKTALSFVIGNEHPVFGHPLTVTFPSPLLRGNTFVVRVHYETTPESSAIQWLTPSQTAGKKHPYLFTQCQAIHARTMLPCQDTPYVKATYEAHVVIPKNLVAVMSANSSGSRENADGKTKTHDFELRIPIPSYLIALAIGALVSKQVGPRSSVWSEAETIAAAAAEFSETEDFIKTAESLVGPYVWGKYDILMLPPSFPYGGMENPLLTFVTPTLIAGDKSNADVVAHEISHSWTGNLVTNKGWAHFWLNEGCTMYLERKILAKLHGEKYFDFDAAIGWKHLQDDIDHFGATNPLTALVPVLTDTDPDDAFSSVPYEKGFTFLVYLEELIGGRKAFEPFFKAWIESHHYKTVTSNDFKEFFLGYWHGKVDKTVLAKIDWEAWFTTPGMPLYQPKYDTSLSSAATELASKWLAGNHQAENLTKWTAKQLMMFLDKLLDSPKALSVAALESLDKLYHFSDSKNAEIKFRWYSLGLKADWKQVVDGAVDFVTSQGRMKFTRPLYRSLFKSSVGKAAALDAFAKHKDFYHGVARKMIAKDLQLE